MNERTRELANEAEDYADAIVDQGGDFHLAYTRKFAELVRADEREACAKVCEQMSWPGRSDETLWKGDASDECAIAIRARGNHD